jgi:hypothetical protein
VHHASSSNLRDPALSFAKAATNAPNRRFSTASITPGMTK